MKINNLTLLSYYCWVAHHGFKKLDPEISRLMGYLATFYYWGGANKHTWNLLISFRQHFSLITVLYRIRDLCQEMGNKPHLLEFSENALTLLGEKLWTDQK